MALKRMTPAKKGAAKKAPAKKAPAKKAKTDNTVMKPAKLTVAAHIAGLENPNRRVEAEALVNVFDKATGWQAQMWGPSIIGYGRYSYTYESGRQGDSCVLGFSPRKGAISLYVHSSSSETAALLAKLGKTRKEVSCVYVNKLADIDLGVLEKLVKAGKTASLKTYNERGWPVSAI